MSIAIGRHTVHPAAHHKVSPHQALLSSIKLDYEKKRMDTSKLYKPSADPDTDASLKGTAALKLYQATMGEGKDLDMCTDGDHLVYRRSSGELCVETFPEDAGRGDNLWVFDKTGQKLIAHGVSHDYKLRWDAPKK